ncbi:hypothetical protein B0H10DRAFT_2215974 [Mycena sp. CBHHK59/15]|nr:hypothetical protein B0H10DRAFT_2215974 [Mycena sp. CBHHK59/15]
MPVGHVVALSIALLVPAATCQTTRIVTVGVEGSFFNPATTSAQTNDIVTFVFGGDFHSVTQSSFESPCVRLAGGFDSGFAGRGPQYLNPTLTWNLRITNSSEAIWFFCEATVPTSHCQSGMVGVINPPSIQMYNQFLSAAKVVTSTPPPSPSFLPSGQGAFATNSPMPSSTPSGPVSTVTLAPQTTSVLPMPTQAVASGPNRALIAGCVTAGVVILLVLGILSLYHFRRWRTYRYRVTPTPTPFGDLNDIFPHRDKAPSAVTSSPDVSTSATHIFPPMTPPPMAGYEDTEKTMKPNAHDRTPTRGIRPLPKTPSQALLQDAEAQDSHAQVDMNSLAMEVASVLLNTPPRPGSRHDHLHSARNNTRYESSSSNTSAPPHYRPN